MAKNIKRTLEIAEIIKLYEEGRGTTEIAKQANVSARTINYILKENNVERRPRGSWKRQYPLNENYFKTWSNNMAYILGFFVADGFVAKDFQSISFAQKDKQILEEIKIELESGQPIIQNIKTGVYILTLNSKIMRADMVDLHGIKPKKSLNVKFPFVPEEYMSHFIRGYFDGDGCVYENKNFVNIVGGSLEFMESLFHVFENQNFEPILKIFYNHYRVYISGSRNVKKFSDWIYNDKQLFLHRKYERFMNKN